MDISFGFDAVFGGKEVLGCRIVASFNDRRDEFGFRSFVKVPCASLGDTLASLGKFGGGLRTRGVELWRQEVELGVSNPGFDKVDGNLRSISCVWSGMRGGDTDSQSDLLGSFNGGLETSNKTG